MSRIIGWRGTVPLWCCPCEAREKCRGCDCHDLIALTPREREVLLAYGRLGSYRAVAADLGISRFTVRQHLINVRQKCNVETSVQALSLVLGQDVA